MKESLIEHIEKIAVAAKNSNLEMKSLESVSESVNLVSKFIKCPKIHTILFCVIFLNSIERRGVDFREIANYLELNITKFFDNMYNIDILIKKKLIYKESRGKRHHEIDYYLYISSQTIEAVWSGNYSLLKKNKIKDVYGLLQRANELFEDRSNNEINYSELEEEFNILLGQNRKLHFVKTLNSFRVSDYENLLLTYMCNELVERTDNEVELGKAMGILFSTTRIVTNFKKLIIQDKTRLQKLKLIKMRCGFFRNDKYIMLTDNSIRLLFGNDAEVYLENNSYSSKNIIPNQSLIEKQLYYDERIRYDINFITDLLNPEKFEKVQNRLAENKLQKGLIILFHGAAGTGKTETVMQIAKKTNRDIFNVDISDIKDMYYGESEKRIKAIFDTYRSIVKKSKIQPILLFNEADGIISSRKNINHSSVGQTENAIQNIILNEMETLDGIMIATTNLIYNFDDAFDRRFHYKIRFDKPDIKTKIKIWKDKIPQLEEKEAEYLAGNFDFSGGQIDNIARKCLMKSVLKDKQPDINELKRFCEQESVIGKQNKIGFQN